MKPVTDRNTYEKLARNTFPHFAPDVDDHSPLICVTPRLNDYRGLTRGVYIVVHVFSLDNRRTTWLCVVRNIPLTVRIILL
jgi:hypothetical protein